MTELDVARLEAATTKYLAINTDPNATQEEISRAAALYIAADNVCRGTASHLDRLAAASIELATDRA